MTITGLSKKEVSLALEKYGYNEIVSKGTSSLKRIIKKLWSPIPWMIEFAALLSALLSRWEDFSIIIILLLVNIFVDYKQESKALNALELLKNKLAKKAIVLRDGKYKEIDARYLVPGDIVKLKIGDIVPADAELIKGEYLEIDQSALTGESLPVNKMMGDLVYSNSIIKIGEMLAEVKATGSRTYFGKSVSLVALAQKEKTSHFQKAVIHIGNFLILFTLVISIFVIGVSIARGEDLLTVLQFILILVIASVPVALPAVLSVTMAVGAISLSKRKAIVSDLPAIEELAGIDTLCIDKTGTLTQNKMSVSNPLVYSGFNKKDLFVYAVLASTEENKDPIEMPIFDYFNKNFSKNELKGFLKNKFIPFDPIRKRTEIKVEHDEKESIIVKGAPQVVIDLCDDNSLKESLLEDVHGFAQNGYRTIAVAIKNKDDKNFKIVGLIPLSDPPRRDSLRVIKKIKSMGIDVKMLTGDNHAIALQIANKLNIGKKIVDVESLEKDNVSLATKLIQKVSGFSQVMPEDKYFIVENLQNNNHIVAMTGDGVNDAPALQKADVGIAVSGATDAARAASDLILLSPGLSVINHAICIARETFTRMKSYAIFRIAETLRIILFMALSIIVFNFYPITAIMVIVLALLNDIPVMMIAYDKAPSHERPVKWDMKEVVVLALVLGVAGVASSFILFFFLHTNNYPLAMIQALLFIKLDVAGHSTLYLTRTGRHHFWHKPWPSLKFFVPAFSSRIIGTLMAVYGIFMEPIGWKYAGYMWIYATLWWIFNDNLKVLTYKILDRRK